VRCAFVESDGRKKEKHDDANNNVAAVNYAVHRSATRPFLKVRLSLLTNVNIADMMVCCCWGPFEFWGPFLQFHLDSVTTSRSRFGPVLFEHVVVSLQTIRTCWSRWCSQCLNLLEFWGCVYHFFLYLNFCSIFTCLLLSSGISVIKASPRPVIALFTNYCVENALCVLICSLLFWVHLLSPCEINRPYREANTNSGCSCLPFAATMTKTRGGGPRR